MNQWCVLQGEVWQDSGASRPLLVAAVLVAAWIVLLAVKLGLGYTLKLMAHAYMQHYEERLARVRWEEGRDSMS